MRMYIADVAVLTILVLIQSRMSSGQSIQDQAPTGGDSITPDPYEINTVNNGDAYLAAGVDPKGSLDICIQSCACGCAAQLGISVSGSASIDGQNVSASGDASLNGYLDNCGSQPNAESPDGSLPDSPSGNAYAIGVHRNSLIYSDNDVVYTQIVDENEQPVTYYETVDVDNPFMIDGWLWNSTGDILTISRDEGLNACLQYEEGTWEKLVADVILKQLSPTASCPINPGTYNIYKDFQVTETFDAMLSCNPYTALLYVINSKGQWSFQFSYQLNVDEGQCASD